MDMSFKEKSTWISLVSTLAIFGYYFVQIWGLSGLPKEQATEQALTLLIYVIILSVVVESLFHGMLAATNHKAAKLGADERDKILEYKSNNLGYTVLAVGVLLVLGRIIILESNSMWQESESSLQIPMLTAHMLMFSFVLSEVVRFAALVYQYRRSA